MTYIDRILSDLSSGEWVCASRWLSDFMPTYSQRLSEENALRLRQRRPRIESRPCHDSSHRHRSPLFTYRDTAVEAQLRMNIA